MATKCIVATFAIIHNSEGKFLVVKRSLQEDQAPGQYSYPGGKVEFADKKPSLLEDTLRREVKEELNIEISDLRYLGSESFIKDNGDPVVAVTFLAAYSGGELKVDEQEHSEAVWLSIDETSALEAPEYMKQAFSKGQKLLQQEGNLHHVTVAGLVTNEQHQFLLIKEADGSYSFPAGPVANEPGKTWELLEDNVTHCISELTGVELAEGKIPFTDQSFIGRDGFDTIMEFFICRSKKGDTKTKSNVVWLKFEEFDKQAFKPKVYEVFTKANDFMQKLSEF